eukprot:SAG31_NODE_42650_length_270_cov_1.181287_1_plen_31_part_01
MHDDEAHNDDGIICKMLYVHPLIESIDLLTA